MMALSILHGGPGPTLFPPVIIDYIFSGMSGVRAQVEDVPDIDIRRKLAKVCIYPFQKNLIV